MNGLRQIGDVLASEAVLVANPTADRERAAELAAIDTMLSAVIAARGRKYLMMNAPSAKLPELERLLPGARVADGHPARARRDDRDPLGRRGGRGLGPAAAAQGRRGVRDPRPARSRRSSRERPVAAATPAPRPRRRPAR